MEKNPPVLQGLLTEFVPGRRKTGRLSQKARQRLGDILPRLLIHLNEDKTQLADPARLMGQACALEIGFGGGEYMAALARMYPGKLFIGVEPYIGGIAKLLQKIDEDDLHNILVYPGDARSLIRALPDQTFELVSILFADPWPKKRHHKRRIVTVETMEGLARICAPGASLRLATDHQELAHWTLQVMDRQRWFEWQAVSADDWRCRPQSWPATRYEKKALEQGRKPIYLSYIRKQHL